MRAAPVAVPRRASTTFACAPLGEIPPQPCPIRPSMSGSGDMITLRGEGDRRVLTLVGGNVRVGIAFCLWNASPSARPGAQRNEPGDVGGGAHEPQRHAAAGRR